MNKKPYRIIALSLLLVLLLASCSSVPNDPNSIGNSASGTVVNQGKKEDFTIDEKEYDFWRIKQSGGKVEHSFPFMYNGKEPLVIKGVPTSCACTSAKIDKTSLNPGDTATITVTFDPNLHEEPTGKFFKTVSLLTEPSVKDTPELKIWAEIDLDLGPKAYKLKEKHNDH